MTRESQATALPNEPDGDDRTAGRTVWVGPVLRAGAVALAAVAVIQELNPETEIVDRGAYLRVRAPGRCVLTRACMEKHLGYEFRLPSDLEKIMPSFEGRLRLTMEEAVWEG